MRNPNRLDGFYDQMKFIHKTYFPDYRFGQLMSNFFGYVLSEGYTSDIFFPEDAKWEEWLKEYAEGGQR